jgi:pilus assembly protein CpaE
VIPIILFDASSAFLVDMQKKLKSENSVQVTAAIAQIPELEVLLRKNQDAVLIMGPTFKREDVVSIAEAVSSEHPQLGIILISSDMTTDLLRDALRVGIRDVLPSAITTKQLLPAVERAYQHSQRIKNAMTGFGKEAAASTEKKPHEPAKVITFFSAKGGVGKTFIASNIAVALAQQTKSKVVLADLDLQFGDVAVMLQLTPERTIYDVISSMERLDADMMEGFLTAHSSGLKTLLSPVQPNQADAISGKHILKIMEVLRGMSDYLIIDTSSSFNDNVLAVLDSSDEIYLVATMDVPSLKNTRLSVHMMDMLQYPKEKMSLVLNRANSKVRLTPKDVERALEMKPVASIPSDIIVPLSVNKGIPLVLDLPRSGVSRSLFQLVDYLKDRSTEKSFEVRHRTAVN